MTVVVPNLTTSQTGITFRHPLPPVHCSRRQTGYDLTVWRFFRGFGDMHGKLHGLPKKVLKFSVIIAYCQFFGIVRKFLLF